MILENLNEEKQIRWEQDRLQAANKGLSVSWRKQNVLEFEERELLELTRREAAIKLLSRFMGKGEDTVWKDIEKGRKLLPPNAIDKLEEAWNNRRHDPQVCQLLKCPHTLD